MSELLERQLSTESEAEYKKPRKWKVLLHNDEITPYDFVVLLMMSVFEKSYNSAVSIASSVHINQFGLVGVFSKEIAELKLMLVDQECKPYGYPLKMTMEPE